MPESDYPQRLADWMEKKAVQSRRRRSSSKVAVLAVKKEIMAALAAGFDLINIHEHMRETGMISMSYESFRRHVQQLKKESATTLSAAPLPSPTAATSIGHDVPGAAHPTGNKAAVQAPSPAGFKFNPVPKKEELL